MEDHVMRPKGEVTTKLTIISPFYVDTMNLVTESSNVVFVCRLLLGRECTVVFKGLRPPAASENRDESESKQ